MSSSPLTNGAAEAALNKRVEAARQELAHGRLAAADKLANTVLEEDPANVGALIVLATLAYLQGSDDLAAAQVDMIRDLLRDRLEEFPSDPRIRTALITLLLSLGEVERAEALVGKLDLAIEPTQGGHEVFFDSFQRALEQGLPSLVVTGAPFTGADFLAQRLAQGLGAPLAALGIGLFPRKILVPSKCFVASPGGIIAPDAIAATPMNLQLLGQAGLGRLVVTSRDPRAALDTWATTLIADGMLRAAAVLWRDIFPPTKVLRRGRQAVIDWSLEALLPQMCGFLQDWLAMAESSGLMVSFLRMEDLVARPQAAYEQVLRDLSIDRNLFDFEAAGTQSRSAGDEGWRRNFTPHQLARARTLIPDDLVARFGWKL